MISAEYTIEYKDYLAAQRLYLRHRPLSGIVWFCTYILLPAIAWLVVAWCAWIAIMGDSARLKFWLPQGALALWIGLALPFTRWWHLRRAYKRIFDNADNRVVQFTATEEYVISAVPGKSEGKFYWNAILDYVENQTIALLFVRKKMFLMLPARGLKAEQFIELRALVEAKVKGESAKSR